MSLAPTPRRPMPPLEHNPLPFRSITERLKLRWDRMLRTLTEKSDAFWLDLAVGAFRQKRYADALVNLYQALALNPYNGNAFKLKGMILQFMAFEARDIDQHDVQIQAMLDAYEHAARLDPALKSGIQRRLRHLYHFEFKRGVQAFRRGAIVAPSYRVAAVYFELAARIRDMITSDVPAPDRPWTASVNQAVACLQAGDPNTALLALEHAVAHGDTSENTVLLLAERYEEVDAHEKAVPLLEQAWRDPASDKTLLEAPLLNAYLRAGLTDRALSIYEEALAREPDHPLLRYNYGTLLLEKEAYGEAVKHLRAAVDLAPDDARAHFNLGAAFFNEAVNRYGTDHEDAVRRRHTLFLEAAGPFEKARSLLQNRGAPTPEVDAILYAVYTQTGQDDKADALDA